MEKLDIKINKIASDYFHGLQKGIGFWGTLINVSPENEKWLNEFEKYQIWQHTNLMFNMCLCVLGVGLEWTNRHVIKSSLSGSFPLSMNYVKLCTRAKGLRYKGIT